MATALVLYGTNGTATTLSTAGLLANATGASGNHNSTTKIGTSTGYGEIWSQGTSAVWPAAGSLAVVAPSGNGWLYDSTALEQQQIIAGTWTAIINTSQNVQTSASIMDFYVRAWKIANDNVSYSLIGNIGLTVQSVTTTSTNYTLTASLPAMNFGVGDKLYLDVVYNISTNNTGSSTATAKFFNSNSLTQGRANNMQVTTPGYNASITSNIQITDAGVNLLRNSAQNSDDDTITFVAFGSSSTAPTAADTQLGAEIYRIPVTSYTVGGTGEIFVTGYLPSSALVGQTINEIGFIGGTSASINANTGVLLAHGLYTLASKTNLESFSAVLDLTFTHA